MLLITQLRTNCVGTRPSTPPPTFIEGKFDAQETNQSTLQEGGGEQPLYTYRSAGTQLVPSDATSERALPERQRTPVQDPAQLYLTLTCLTYLTYHRYGALPTPYRHPSLEYLCIRDYLQQDPLCSGDGCCFANVPTMCWVMGLGWLAHRILPYLMHLASRLEPAAGAQNITEQSPFCQIMDS
ncbi:hypothetical protein CABS01_04665 [Colletotrichum abscissum]|uniref:uncharacterized protein n=1 Tax=Colletotrichum abscissum TaxID=1671311 RepID=UPI0027D66795|nr:uncharacterized protein CABS01_04665 [Colletotrichum abscissum]KAK1472022.1 hypothetical protein CABS01_04665 [Colletotrichum abscissum]